MEVIQKQQTNGQSQEAIAEVPASPSACCRCGGLLVVSFCISPDQGSWVYQIPVMRCLQCGDLVDSTILKNRRLSNFQHSINLQGGSLS